jgi:hypothetical protein
LTYLEHPYKVGEQMAYLQSEFTAWIWMNKSQRIFLKGNRSFKIKLFTLYDHSLAEFIYFYGFNHYFYVKQLPNLYFQPPKF